MAHRTIKLIAAVILVIICLMPNPIIADNDSATSPKLNNGKKWRIGYHEGGPYINYTDNLRTLVAGLVKLGWMAPINIPKQTDTRQSKLIWDFLAQNTQSDYIVFVPDAHWSAEWSKEKRKIVKDEIIQRLNKQKDIDFMIAMGTWAAQDLSNNRHQTPTMAVSVSDPVRAGISALAEDSGLDHFHAKCDPTRYIRQLRLFHRLVRFKKLGVVYENTAEGKTYAAFDDIHKVAKERGFSVVLCDAPISGVDEKASVDSVIQCHESLAKKVDAVYVTVHRGVKANRMKELTAPFIKHRIPTWSQRGPKEVKRGLLLSISRGGFKSVGQYHAEVMAKIFNGKKPRSINQIYEDPKLIAINRKVAELIQFKIPGSMMRIAGEVYETIEE